AASLIAGPRTALRCRDRNVIGRRDGLRGWRRRRSSGAWKSEQLDAFAVDAHLEVLRLDIDRHLLVQITRQLNTYRVIRIHRKRVANRRAASRTKQLSWQPLVLREIVGNTEVVDIRERRG